jgi:hypothetical protein
MARLTSPERSCSRSQTDRGGGNRGCGKVRCRRISLVAGRPWRRSPNRPHGRHSASAAGTALFAPYLSFAIPVGIGSVAGQPRGRFAQHPVTGLICSLTLGTLLRSRVVLSVSARPRPMSRGFDLPKEGRFLGFSLCVCLCKIVNRRGVTGLRNSHARIKRRTEGIRPSARKAVLELAESFDRLARAAFTPAVLRRRELARKD